IVERHAEEEAGDDPGQPEIEEHHTEPLPSMGRALTAVPVTVSIVAAEDDAVKLHAVIDQAEAELLGDPALERFQLFVDELDDVAGLDVDEMVVMALGCGLVAGAAV